MGGRVGRALSAYTALSGTIISRVLMVLLCFAFLHSSECFKQWLCWLWSLQCVRLVQILSRDFGVRTQATGTSTTTSSFSGASAGTDPKTLWPQVRSRAFLHRLQISQQCEGTTTSTTSTSSTTESSTRSSTRAWSAVLGCQCEKVAIGTACSVKGKTATSTSTVTSTESTATVA